MCKMLPIDFYYDTKRERGCDQIAAEAVRLMIALLLHIHPDFISISRALLVVDSTRESAKIDQQT